MSEIKTLSLGCTHIVMHPQCAYLFLVESACRHIRDSLQKTEIPDVHPKSKLEDNKRNPKTLTLTCPQTS
jgi:hypothetical protein